MEAAQCGPSRLLTMKYSIQKYGSKVLRLPAVDVARVDEKIRQLARDMLTVMYQSNGVGLAAQQIGRQENICVIDTTGMRPREGDPENEHEHRDRMPLVMINPQIISQSGERKIQEGCLSVPDVFASIKRSAEVTVVFKNLDGREETLQAGGLLARAIQHELDHLSGKVIVDRMSTVQKVSCSGKLKKLKKEVQESDS